MMRCWEVSGRPRERRRVVAAMHPKPSPADGEILVRVSTCGVCRTDLHLADLELAPFRPNTVPGHQVVGEVVATGAGVTRFALGERVGVAWLRRTCGACTACRNGRENLCRAAQFTGWNADGGFAEYTVVPAAFAYRIPASMDDVAAAPMLCSGIIGYRALRRAPLRPGGNLGLYGFGASAHLAAQVAIAQGSQVHVFTRGEAARRLATELGAASVQDAADPTPVPLDAAILFAPVGSLVPVALRALDQGGTLAIAGIHLTEIPQLDYQEHLFRERTITSVTANTRSDGEEFLRLAAALNIRAHTTVRGFDAVDDTLDELARGDGVGSLVVRVS